MSKTSNFIYVQKKNMKSNKNIRFFLWNPIRNLSLFLLKIFYCSRCQLVNSESTVVRKFHLNFLILNHIIYQYCRLRLNHNFINNFIISFLLQSMQQNVTAISKVFRAKSCDCLFLWNITWYLGWFGLFGKFRFHEYLVLFCNYFE